ncbi:MAG TPA: hypothetical protein VEH04_04985 [Verrucomicrobiae bacterium]|nr:hypothetical protein [Verrucomicrobiae bacterium]
MREVKTQDWAGFWERVNQNERGGTLNIHKVEPNGAKIQVASNVAFDTVEFGRRDDCNDRIALRTSGEAGRDLEIVEPIRIKLMESENGTAYQSVIVEAEDGVTILTFHPTLKADWLKDLDLQ